MSTVSAPPSDDFQAAATQQGRDFEDAVVVILKVSGWTIIGRHAKVCGAEIDIVADDPTGRRWWIECKGSWRGRTPGSRRGDTVKKAIAVAWFLSRAPDRCPYMLITSHLPNPGTLNAQMLYEAQVAGLFDHVWAVGGITLPDDEDEVDE